MEIWKPIKNFEDRYHVSNKGRVRSLLDNRQNIRPNPLVLKPVVIGHKPNNLYLAVNLSNKGGQKQYVIHRLVAITFIDNPHNLPLVNHKDEITFNNEELNLEWCTHQYNQEYSLSKKIYSFINPEGVEIRIHNLRKFSRENNLNHSHMYQVHLGNYKTHKGWRTLCSTRQY